MSETQPPGGAGLPPGNPPPPPQTGHPGRPGYPYPPPRDGKPVSFYLAIFLALLLFVSGGLNLLLLFVSAIGSATSGFATTAEDDGAMYEIVAVAGDPEARDRLLRIPVQGAIAEAGSPLIGAVGGTVSRVKRALRVAGRDDDVKGVLLDINSPGGGVTDSDEIWRLISEFREEHGKPVMALFGDMAASGGYYIAAACDKIMARPTSITGSIGVILSFYNFKEAADKLGVDQVTITSGKNKDMLSPFSDPTPEELAIVQSIVDEMYARFVQIVADGRSELDIDRVRQLADGRIYSADQALDNGLIDAIGSVEDAYAVLRDLAGVESARVVEQRRLPTLGEALFGIRGRRPSLEATAAQLLQSGTGPRFLYFWQGGR